MSQRAPACRSCGAGGLSVILSLGRLPLANALLTADRLDRPEHTYPLDWAFCPRCALVQITETVPPEQLFREYVYFSSFSDTMLRHVRALVEQLILARRLNSRSLVVEIASNDGYLLQYYKQAGVPVLGVEPADNVARVAEEERGIPTLCAFFGEGLALDLSRQGRRADVIHAHNVLAHVADLNGFVGGIRHLLKDDGVAVVEVPHVLDMVERCEFDTIYHEHLCYFSLTALDRLFRRHGLHVREVERVPVHGGSLRLFLVPDAAAGHPAASVADLLALEARRGLDRPEGYRDFADRVARLRSSLRDLLGALRQEGKRLAGYGAAAKAAVLLNYCGLGRETLDFVADRSPYKQGRFLPGVRLPIVSPDRLLVEIPDYVLLLSWNLAEEVLAQQEEYRRRGGRFIIPVPEPEVV